MFWRKAKKIKMLKGDLEAALIGSRAMERMRDTARDGANKLVAVQAEQTKRINDLISERDAFAKKVEESQQAYKEMVAYRDQLFTRVEELEGILAAREEARKYPVEGDAA